MRAIRIHGHGGPDVLRLDQTRVPEPPPGHVRVRIAAAGVNFVEVYQRTGLYPVPLPATPGAEGAGEVVSLGADVTTLRVGDRVASVNFHGSYAEEAVVAADRAVKVPDGFAINTAAAVLLQGMTAHYLASDTFPLRAGHTCVVHAAAGGVGQLLVQMAKARGAHVVATVSTVEKAEIARAAGADEVVLYTRESFRAAARAATGGRGADVVFDSVGKTTFEESLDALRPRGMLALFGQSSGAVPPIEPLKLMAKGSLFLTRTTLADYVATRDDLVARADALFRGVAGGSLRVRIDRELPLAQAGEAHRVLEARQTTGKVLLVP